MIKRILCVTIALFLTFQEPGSASEATPGLHSGKTILAPDGLLRYFHYYVPRNFKPQMPVVIILHGGTQDYNKILRQESALSEWLPIADEQGIFLLIPNGINPRNKDANGTNQHWNDCRADASQIETGADDVGFIRVLIDWAIKSFSVDATSVYATGGSNGGLMSYRLAFELSDKIAAIAAFIANLPENSECKWPVRPIPVMICNGTKDPLIPWNGGKGEHGKFFSAPETRDFWIKTNGIPSIPDQTKHFTNLDLTDGSSVQSDLYSGAKDKSEVLFYTVTGGGHSMPSIDHKIRKMFEWLLGKQNHDIESVHHAWSFLNRQKLRPAQ
jgi:polyhydroxybutyrate depolymerase